MTNPLAWIVRRYPRPFRLEWVNDVTYVQTAPNTYDERDVRYLASSEVQCIDWPEETNA